MSKTLNSDTANKIIKNLNAEITALLNAEETNRTYSYSPGETPIKPEYSFAETQRQIDNLRSQVAKLRHAINVFNVNTPLEKNRVGSITIDEALNKMSVLNGEKKRLYEMLRIPETERTRSYGRGEADIVCRNFNIDEVRKRYDSVCSELMDIQQAINIANLTYTFEVEDF